jgi:hypothetical protein
LDIYKSIRRYALKRIVRSASILKRRKNMGKTRWRIIAFSYLNNSKECIRWASKSTPKAPNFDFPLRSFIFKEPKTRTKLMNNLPRQSRPNLPSKNSLLFIDLRRLLDRI